MRKHRPLANQRGQGLAEAAISIVVLTLLALGMVQFGYAWLEIAMITHAARDAARAAAIVPGGMPNRDASGVIQSGAKTQILDNLLLPTLQGVMSSSTASSLRSASTITQALGPPATVTVTVGGAGTTIPFMFNLPLMGSTFAVNRSVTFRDEGR